METKQREDARVKKRQRGGRRVEEKARKKNQRNGDLTRYGPDRAAYLPRL